MNIASTQLYLVQVCHHVACDGRADKTLKDPLHLLFLEHPVSHGVIGFYESADFVIAAVLNAVIQVALAHGAGGGKQILNRLGEPAADYECDDDGDDAHDQGGRNHGIAYRFPGRHDGTIRQGNGGVPCHQFSHRDRGVVGSYRFVFQVPAAHRFLQGGCRQRQDACLVDQAAFAVEQGGATHAFAAGEVIELDLQEKGVVGEQGFAGRIGQLLGNSSPEAVSLIAHTAELIVQ